MMILVHKTTFTASSKMTVSVRVKAGEHEVCTDPSSSGVFQQALSVFVEQGTECVKFELINTSEAVLAELHLNVMKDLLQHDNGKVTGDVQVMNEKTFNMKQKNKNFLNPRIVLTFAPEAAGDEEQALLSNLNASAETEWMLQHQLHKTQAEVKAEAGGKPPEQLSEIALLAKGCVGPLHMFGMMGSKSLVYVGILGPPRRKKFAWHIWGSEHDYREDKPSMQEVELLRVSAVAPDPGRPEVFNISYVAKDKTQTKAMFQRIDRGRDVWVELLQILVTKVHEDYESKKKEKRK